MNKKIGYRPSLIGLEDRCVPSSAQLPALHLNMTAIPLDSPNAAQLETPAMQRTAYNIPSSATGKGQTIAIVAATDNPTIVQDLAAYDATYGIPAPHSFRVLYVGGHYPADPDWNIESALDVEESHAMAPQANIVLVLAPPDVYDMLNAVETAASIRGVTDVSMSWGTDAFASDSVFDSYFQQKGVVYLASSGDSATASWPSVSKSVLSIGGTSLYTDAAGHYDFETLWALSGRGGNPDYRRGTPDVSFDGDPKTGVPTISNGVLWQVGGTSVSSPAQAGIAADLMNVIGRHEDTTTYRRLLEKFSKDFHRIAQGGIGTPEYSRLANDLNRYTHRHPARKAPAHNHLLHSPETTNLRSISVQPLSQEVLHAAS